MQVRVRAAIVAILMVSGSAMAGGMLGADDKAGLWEDQLHSNLELFLSRDFYAGKLSPRQQKKLSDDLIKGPGGVRRFCGTQEQAQHPRLLVGAATNCTSGPVTITGTTAHFDLTCHAKLLLHAKIAFDSPEHVTITITGIPEMPATPPNATIHDLHWISADCGGLKPGDFQELVEPHF